LITWIICCEELKNIKFSTIEFCPTSWYCLPVTSTCFPKHPVLDHLQSTFSS
jgi:hypothetical protein